MAHGQIDRIMIGSPRSLIMPRKVLTPRTAAPCRPSRLVEELAGELRSEQGSGQPSIEEEHLKTGAIRVVVLWDKWDSMPQEDRSAVILDAYRLVEGEDFAARIGLVNGLTFPEAHALRMLPFQIIPSLRENDPVTVDQCHRAMIAEGASTLLGPGHPQLRYATQEEAEASVKRLSSRLSGSMPVWYINQDLDHGLVMSWDATE